MTQPGWLIIMPNQVKSSSVFYACLSLNHHLILIIICQDFCSFVCTLFVHSIVSIFLFFFSVSIFLLVSSPHFSLHFLDFPFLHFIFLFVYKYYIKALTCMRREQESTVHSYYSSVNKTVLIMMMLWRRWWNKVKRNKKKGLGFFSVPLWENITHYYPYKQNNREQRQIHKQSLCLL